MRSADSGAAAHKRRAPAKKRALSFSVIHIEDASIADFVPDPMDSSAEVASSPLASPGGRGAEEEPVHVIPAPVAAREVSRSNRGRRLAPREASRSEADVLGMEDSVDGFGRRSRTELRDG